uniref:Tetratricopeptide repeat protein n=1 Tax=Schlesneria paludicola TaxID=360056 RepID=A0A7C4LJN1_9PLAN
MSVPVPPAPLPPATWHEVERLLETNCWSQAIDRLRELANETGSLEVRLSLGALLAEHEWYCEAIREWTVVVEEAAATGRWLELAAAYSNLAAVYRDLGDFALARSFQQQALRLVPDCDAADLLHLANDALACGRCELAEALLRSAADLCAAEDPMQAAIIASAGIVRLLEGTPRAAAVFLRQSYRRHRDAGNWRFAGYDLWNLAAAMQQLGRLRLAERYLKQAAECFALAGRPGQQLRAQFRGRQMQRLRGFLAADPRQN